MLKTALIIAALTMAGSAAAQTTIESSNRQLAFAVGRQHVDYVEYDNYGVTSNGTLDSEKGSQPAFSASYTWQGDAGSVSDLYVDVAAAYAKGKSNYDGYLQNFKTGALTPYQSRTHVSTTDFRARIGKGFGINGGAIKLTPYLAYAYHEWERDSSSDQYGYLEVYDHQSLSAGLLAQFALGQRMVASVDYSYGRTFDAQMQVEHSTTFTLGAKPVSTLGVGLDYALSKTLHLSGRYGETRFKYGESNVIGGFLEPNSKTTLKNAYLGLGFAF